jgi:hypothetical protein
MAIVNFPTQFVLNRSTRMRFHNGTEVDIMEGGAYGRRELTNQKYVTVPCVVDYLFDDQKDTLVDFLDTNQNNDIVWPIDGKAYLGTRLGDYQVWKTGNVWSIEFSFYGVDLGL